MVKCLNDTETGIIPASVKLVIEQFFREIGTTGRIALQSPRRTSLAKYRPGPDHLAFTLGSLHPWQS